MIKFARQASGPEFGSQQPQRKSGPAADTCSVSAVEAEAGRPWSSLLAKQLAELIGEV